MKNEKLAELTDEQLIKSEKQIKGLILVFTGVLIVLLVSIIFLTSKKGFSALTAVPMALIPILVINLNNWNELRKEKKARNLS
ncbi:1,4-dihydroxy-2-naphthoate octaprenyltransferase [Chryseobacterium sp. H1D6B]|uniref:redox-active disulfide protein 2 n=1 Tax=Chryseobacterium sp. H1D6B TaxID=2940588 RepID=UPI0015C9CC85|nr:redox-active disulfide protein 2 [Chryseobacterium sp. H1D6B]MDH6252802.1 1,4-dihydroxy-2-naphthoate octaprenyltransferase [Chryseobacterium sp. H1D6B]